MSRIIFQNIRIRFLARKEITKCVYLSKYSNISENIEREMDSDQASTLYVSTCAEYVYGKKNSIKKLEELFNLNTLTATDIVSRYRSFNFVSGRTLSNNCELLETEGIMPETMLEYADILAHCYLKQKIDLLKLLKYPIQDTLPLLSLNQLQLHRLIVDKIQKENRLERMAELYQVPIISMCVKYVRWPHLISVSMKTFERNLVLLTEYGMTVEEIRNDSHAIWCKTTVLEERIAVLKKLNIVNFKPWAIRSSHKVFNSCITKIHNNNLVLGNSTLAEYLSKRLNCSKYEAKKMVLFYPILPKMNAYRIDTVIEFLIKEGITAADIVRHPHIMYYSMQRTRVRLRDLEEKGIKFDNLELIITATPKQYKEYCDNYLVKMNKSKINAGV